MIREIVERFNYRYRLWLAENRAGKLGAGEDPSSTLRADATAPHLVIRHIFVLLCGLIIITGLGRLMMRILPEARSDISIGVIVVAAFWCIVGLVTLASQLISRKAAAGDSTKII